MVMEGMLTSCMGEFPMFDVGFILFLVFVWRLSAPLRNLHDGSWLIYALLIRRRRVHSPVLHQEWA